ncbi:hypothetical protein [Moheibacter sediminis]|uniref:TonB protein C-terminal n=1 Tax=Moheibacter sediminis TaxID=1434700 RepID=A0A1W1YI63_9FLAO|nr:hypothetical protein [Moheibacter sediminis]SMC35875.1 hypothetical protein SAMN06296427_101404 [Moheibacter sediminis]
MKKIILTFTLFLFGIGILNAQEAPGIVGVAPQIVENLDEIISKPILPGCEHIQDTNSVEVESCFRSIMNVKITNQLLSKVSEIGDIGLDRLTSIVTVVITKEGLMSNVKIESTNDAQFGKIVEQQMNQIAANVPSITPAKSNNGEAVNYMYRIPVTFVFTD